MIDVRELISYSEASILSRVLLAGKVNMTLFCMAAGTHISEHATSREGCAFVLEGTGVFHINAEAVVMRPGAMIPIPKDAKHSLHAAENTAVLLVLA